MPRRPVSPAERAANVKAASDALPALIARALAVTAGLSDDDVCECPDGNAEGITEAECGCKSRKAWEAVECQGATIHRQGRLLAGKSKGG
jgi:hypothetical protein